MFLHILNSYSTKCNANPQHMSSMFPFHVFKLCKFLLFRYVMLVLKSKFLGSWNHAKHVLGHILMQLGHSLRHK